MEPDPRRIAAACRFLAELALLSAECEATGVWDDELTARRRQREDLRIPSLRSEGLRVKAL